MLILMEKSEHVEANVMYEFLWPGEADTEAKRVQYGVSDSRLELSPWKPSSGRIENASNTI